MDGLQVSGPDADIHPMDRNYRRMGAEERLRHHDELREEGYEWCPECGSALVWELPTPRKEVRRSASVPVVCGDIPPLTAEQLLATFPVP